MTALNRISELFSPTYYKNLMKRSWSHSFICAIVLFLAMPVATLININNIMDNGFLAYEKRLGRITDAITDGFQYIWIALAVAAAVFGGILLMNFLSDRKKAYLYHSFPIKRKTHYFCHIAACVSDFLIAFLLNVLLTLCIFMVTGVAYSEIISAFFTSVSIAFVYYILALSLTVLALTLTGQTSAVFLILLAIAFLPIGIYFSAVQLFDFHENYFYFEHFLRPEIVTRLSAPIRYIYLVSNETSYSAREGIITLLVSCVVFIGAYYIYKRRKIESAGTPVVSFVFGEVLKYMFLFPGTFFLGWMFYSLGNESFFWLIFGFLFGAFLVFLFFNLFLYRSPRKMFYGWKWLCVFVALFLIFFALTFLATGENIPDPEKLDSVDIYISGNEYSFEDEENKKAIVDFSRDMIAGAKNYGFYSYRQRIIFNRNMLFSASRYIPTARTERESKLLLTLMYSTEYIAQLEKLLKEEYKYTLPGSDMQYVSFEDAGYYYEYRLDRGDIIVDRDAFITCALKDIRNPNRYDGQYLGCVHLHNVSFELYSTDINCLTMNINPEFGAPYTLKDILDEIDEKKKDSINKITVTDTKTGNVKSYTGKEAWEIYNSCISRSHYNIYNLAVHPNCDYRYEIEVFYTGNKGYEGESYEASYENRFINGKIPLFVLNDFE